MKYRLLFPLIALLVTAVTVNAEDPKPLRAGVIGLDTSHVLAFTEALNKGAKNPEDEPKIAGVKMVAAYAQGSKDIESSTKRVPEYTEKVKALGVEIVDSIDELLKRVDVVFLESNDGRVHLEQGEAGARRWKARLYRQADRRIPRRYYSHPQCREESECADVLLLFAALWKSGASGAQWIDREGQERGNL